MVPSENSLQFFPNSTTGLCDVIKLCWLFIPSFSWIIFIHQFLVVLAPSLQYIYMYCRPIYFKTDCYKCMLSKTIDYFVQLFHHGVVKCVCNVVIAEVAVKQRRQRINTLQKARLRTRRRHRKTLHSRRRIQSTANTCSPRSPLGTNV